jgi:putative transposase
VTISFKGAHFPKEVILHAVFFYLRYGVSYRDLEEIILERGVDLDHATLNRWVTRYAGCLIPWFDGAICSFEWKEALWDKFVTGAPRTVTRQAIAL